MIFNLIAKYSIQRGNIYNLDETVIFFDPKHHTTIETKGTVMFKLRGC